MLLGLMSLLLSATEEYLLKICVTDNHYEAKPYESKSSSSYPPTDDHSPGYYPPPGRAADEEHTDDPHHYPPPSHRTLLMDGLDFGAHGLRRLSTFSSSLNAQRARMVGEDEAQRKAAALSVVLIHAPGSVWSAARHLLGGGAPVQSCPVGEESFWSLTLIHQAHIFIFCMGLTYIMYCLTCIVLSMLQSMRWRRFEAEARRRESDAEDGGTNKASVAAAGMPTLSELGFFRSIYSLFTTSSALERGQVRATAAVPGSLATAVRKQTEGEFGRRMGRHGLVAKRRR